MGNAVRCASSEAGKSESEAKPLHTDPSKHGDSGVSDTSSTGAKIHPDSNPGAMDELHKKCKEVFPICFDGAKVAVNKGLSNHFQISHTLTLSAMQTGYRFGVTYVGSKQFGPQESYPVLLGDTDLSGNLSATLIHQFTSKIRCKFASQIQADKISAVQLTGEYRGSAATCSLTVANPDLVAESGLIVGSYLRRITPKLDLGADMIYQYGKQIPGKHFSVLQYAARYSGDNFIASGTVGRTGLHLCYFHKQQENLQFGVEWETSFRAQDSVATFGYQLDLPKANVVFRASADSNWTVGAVLEKKLLPLPFTLALSCLLNHAQNKSRVGVGLQIG